MILKGKTAAFVTLGCKLNFSETSSIRRSLEDEGVATVAEKDGADIFVINTCSVTDVAEHKGRQLIRKIAKNNPQSYIVIVGCYAQLRAKELMEIEGVNLVLGINEKFKVADYLKHCEDKQKQQLPHSCNVFEDLNFDIACSYGDRTRCFLKIQDGCNYFCTYCTIPFARGTSRSASIEDVVKTVNEVAAKGVKEVILTGVNTGDFGNGRNENFLQLIQQLDDNKSIERFRISSIEPNLLSDEIIAFVASSRKFMPHFHIPLQAGSNEVLQLMKRRYTTEFFAEKIATINRLCPDAFVGVDIIAGMRGETEELFEKSARFVEDLQISQLHVFPYSERAGTKALEITPAVNQTGKHRRVNVLLEISRQKLKDFHHRFYGQIRNVLFEDNSQHTNRTFISGFTDNYIQVRLPYNPELANQIVPVRLTSENITEDA